MKRVPNDGETTIVVPVILDPIEVQLTLRIVPVEIRNIAVTIRVLPNRADVQNASNATDHRMLSELYRIRNLKIFPSILHQVSSFFRN
jgi:hypothetical protein